MERLYHDPDIGDVVLRKNPRCRRISIRVHPVRGVIVAMPGAVPYDEGLRFFQAKRDWVLRMLERRPVDPLPPAEVEALQRAARAVLPARLAVLAARHGFTYNAVRIKHNSSNWGSCSRKGNINLNLNLMRLPEDLRDYVLLHELCHLRVPNHGPQFHALLETLCPDHRACERALRRYPLR